VYVQPHTIRQYDAVQVYMRHSVAPSLVYPFQAAPPSSWFTSQVTVTVSVSVRTAAETVALVSVPPVDADVMLHSMVSYSETR